MKSEFSRPEPLAGLAKSTGPLNLKANPEELMALAERAGIPKVGSLQGELKAEKIRAGVFLVTGTLKAEVTLECRRSLKPFGAKIEEPISEGFIEKRAWEKMDEAARDLYQNYEIIDNDEIDLGEVVAQNFILSIDPFPVLEDDISEKIVTSGVTVISEEKARERSNPFSKLKKLQNKG